MKEADEAEWLAETSVKVDELLNEEDYVERHCEIIDFIESDGEIHPVFGPEV